MTERARPQRRGKSISMTSEELDVFLQRERTCRIATVGGDGRPHNSPLWYVWDGSALWLNSVVKSQRWANIARNGSVSVVVDTGHDFMDLRGAELIGNARPVGDVPRTGTPNDALRTAERLYGDKYGNGTFDIDGRHAWLRIVPDKIVSWDFRKMDRQRDGGDQPIEASPS